MDNGERELGRIIVFFSFFGIFCLKGFGLRKIGKIGGQNQKSFKLNGLYMIMLNLTLYLQNNYRYILAYGIGLAQFHFD